MMLFPGLALKSGCGNLSASPHMSSQAAWQGLLVEAPEHCGTESLQLRDFLFNSLHLSVSLS